MPGPGKAAPTKLPFDKRRGHILRIAGIFALLGVILGGCQSYRLANSSGFPQDSTLWDPADLRFLDPVDSTGGLDLVALYARQRGADGELRLDFLDIDNPSGFDLYLALDFLPGGGGMFPVDSQPTLPWDACLVIRAHQSPFVIDAEGHPLKNIIPRVVRSPVQDSLTVRWNINLFMADPERLKIEAFLTPSGERTVEDILGPARTDIFPPDRAPLLLAFWDTLPADTPAQALRRWDGAHTGPLGSRHGLANVVDAAAGYQVPVFLLDLKTPNALAALDALGAISRVRTLSRQGLLNLPDVYAGGPGGTHALTLYREISERFDFPTGMILYGALQGESFPGYSLVFGQADDPTHLRSERGVRIVPLPVLTPLGPDEPDRTASLNEDASPRSPTVEPAGLPVDVRAALLRAALSPDPGDLVVLGGSLPQSVWGDFAFSQAAMEYIARHPWIQPLDTQSLQAFPRFQQGSDPHSALCPAHLCPQPPGVRILPTTLEGQQVPPGIDLVQIETFLLGKLSSLPPGDLAETAWLAFTNLTRSTPDQRLRQLRANYLGQIYGLILAAEWAENPKSQSRCDVDADLDGMQECILSTETVFAILEPHGARVTFAFIKESSRSIDNRLPQVFQIIGPASQFSVGISDPSTWEVDGGPASDPNEIPGAFSDQPNPFRPYLPTVVNGGIHFSSLDGFTQKNITILSGGLSIQYFTSTPLTVQVPLALSPPSWYQPGGTQLFFRGRTTQGWTWGLPSSPRLEVNSTAPVQLATMRDSGFLLRSPEDPNQEYPPGHFIPFPLARVDLHVSVETIVEIYLR